MACAVIPSFRRSFTSLFSGLGPALRHFSSEPTQTCRAAKCWQVSSHGRCCDTRGRVSWGCLKAGGYRGVQIFGHDFQVHRVVAFAFLGPPPSKDAWQVHHRDGARSNNNIQNLEYVTPSQNASYSYESLSRTRSKSLQCKPVMWRPAGFPSWTTCPSVAAAAQKLQLDPATVSKCCRNKSASRKGLEFQFAELTARNLQGEEWRPMLDPESGSEVPGRMVSSLGRIKSKHGIVHRGHLSKIGYYETKISLDSFHMKKLVHRLVAFTFLGPPPTQQHWQINHKDGDKSNNDVENLEYVTPSENMVHCHALARSHLKKTDGTRKPVWSRRFGSDHEWTWHPSMAHAAGALNLQRSNISACCRLLLRQTRGFELCYADGDIRPRVLPGEEWREVDLPALLYEKLARLSQL